MKWHVDSRKTRKQAESAKEIAEIENEENIEIIEQEQKPEVSNPYWNYIKMNLINVNFNELRQINS